MTLGSRASLGWRLLAVVLLVVMPLAELYVLIRLGRAVGALPTIGLLVLAGVVGAWLIRREGARAWEALRAALQTGRLPGREVTDAGLILIGGALMLSPGLISDVIGVLFILPLTRPLLRGLFASVISRRLLGTAAPKTRHPGPDPQGSVVRGEVVDDE